MAVLLVVVGAFALGQDEDAALARRVEALIGDLASTDPSTRHCAIEALGGIGPPARAAIPALENIHDDPWAEWARRRIGPGPLPFAHALRKVPAPFADRETAYSVVLLEIEETGQTIPLGPVYDPGSGPRHRMGMDVDSLFLRWLEPRRLLRVSWETISQGTGRHQAQGNLLLYKHGGAWIEVLRDWRPWRTRGSIADYERIELDFEWSGGVLTIRQSNAIGTGWLKERKPLAVETTGDSGTTFYTQAYQYETEWRARIVGGRLTIGPGVQWFRTTREQHVRVHDVAAFLADAPRAAAKRTAEEHAAFLLERNAGLNADGEVTFPVIVANAVPPFAPNRNAIYHTGN